MKKLLREIDYNIDVLVVMDERDEARRWARWLLGKWREANTMAVRNWHKWQEAERQLNDRQRRHTDEWQLAYEKGYGDMTDRAETAEAQLQAMTARAEKAERENIRLKANFRLLAGIDWGDQYE
jgi:hypothetical protein